MAWANSRVAWQQPGGGKGRMRSAEIQQRLLQLAQQHPNEHPYTLALRLQNDTGWMVSGQFARTLLEQARGQGDTQAQP